jgi:Family of unknown function (DUF5662)
MSEFLDDLLKHKRRVGQYLRLAAADLVDRALVHDDSKFSAEEFGLYEAAFPKFKLVTYGTEEYKQVARSLGPALEHHFSVNRHHPEFFPNGVAGMDAMDLKEMISDWLAASTRSNLDIREGLLLNKKRFGIDDQLFSIIEHTVERLRILYAFEYN